MVRIVTLVVACALSLGGAGASEYEILYKFGKNGGKFDGESPYAGVVLDASGNLYGTTVSGGPNCYHHSCGTVFKLAPDGTETILHNFSYGSDGFWPYGGLLLDGAGNLYGTTSWGGSKACHCGTLFKMAPDGTFTVIHTFEGGSQDGAGPSTSLISDAAGNLYGVTPAGGSDKGLGKGTLFRLAPDGTYTILHAFGSEGDGWEPSGSLIMDAQQNLYGTTTGGGAHHRGTVFKLAPDGTETVLYSFGGSRHDGIRPSGNLAFDNAGNLYGTTSDGGKKCSSTKCGTVFAITPAGSERVVHEFGGGSDGEGPQGGLVFDGAGGFYGTTPFGSSENCVAGCGVIFRMTADGQETVLYQFEPPGDNGGLPFAPLMIGADGKLYGTTAYGGRAQRGLVFRVTP